MCFQTAVRETPSLLAISSPDMYSSPALRKSSKILERKFIPPDAKGCFLETALCL